MGLAFVLTDLGALGGNNLVVLVASVLWAAVVVDGVLGWVNLRGLTVVRHLPDELFARQGARGTFEVTRTGRLPVHRIEIGDGVATATAEEVRATVVLPTWWRFPTRGEVEVGRIEVRSAFPFGLFRHRLELGEPAAVLVYPCPQEGAGVPRQRSSVEGRPDPRREGTGDLQDLRPYRPGDRLRSIHWPTSARAGRPMVGLRAAEEDAGRVVRVGEAASESELERATGAVLGAWSEGVAVGLEGLGPALAAPRRGVRWRRRLLEALANAPRGAG